MATRSMVQFGYNQTGSFERKAQLYHHWDGYPSSRLLNIKEAIERAHGSYGKEIGYQYRLESTYPTDLAAFYVLTHKDGAGNVEIDEHLHGDIEFLYQVWQDDNDPEHKFHVRILTTHQPEGEEFDEKAFQAFWDDPAESKMRVMDEGELDKLIERHKEDK